MTVSSPTKQQPAKAKSAPGSSTGSRERGGIQSLERAAAILDAVARSPQGISLAELSTQVGLHTSTAFHLVKTLVQLEFINQMADTKQYRIGSHLFMLAAGALDENALLSIVTPVLEGLSAKTSEAAHLAIRSKNEIVVIARTAASGMLQMSGRTGSTRPAHATAIGKILLSVMPLDDLERLLETLPLTRLTPKTITDLQTLRDELDEIRRYGIAYDDCELDVDVRCVAVPVRDFAGRCVGAIGLSGPVWRLSLQTLQEKSHQLQTAAADLSAQLGFDGTMNEYNLTGGGSTN